MDVIYSGGGFQTLDSSNLETLTAIAKKSSRKRSRICLHESPDSSQHAMAILLMGDSYVRPHMHSTRDETFMIVEGECDVILFDEVGRVLKIITMAAPGTTAPYFYVMPSGQFHGLLVRSARLAFIETTIGPFDPTSSIPAPWAPSESSGPEGVAWLMRQAEFGAQRVSEGTHCI